MLQSTSEYYKRNPAAKKRRVEQQARYNRSSLQIAKRVELNRENRKRGTYGNGDKLDVSHKRGGGTKLESQSSNRRRNRGLA